jgi:hypothetical protein
VAVGASAGAGATAVEDLAVQLYKCCLGPSDDTPKGKEDVVVEEVESSVTFVESSFMPLEASRLPVPTPTRLDPNGRDLSPNGKDFVTWRMM